MSKKVIISKDELLGLLEDRHHYYSLLEGGVDNWQGGSFAAKAYLENMVGYDDFYDLALEDIKKYKEVE